MAFNKNKRRQKIRWRIRKSISGTTERPRLSVFRSNKEIYAQIIDDVRGVTLAQANSREGDVSKDSNKTEQSKQVGHALAQRAKDAGVESVVFDRSGYLFHGRVKALAEGAREGGLKF